MGSSPASKVMLGEVQVWPGEPTSTDGGIRQQATGTWTESGNMTISLPEDTLDTSLIALVIAGNTVVPTPAGWALRESQVNYMGHYLFTLQDSSGVSTWDFTPNPSALGACTWYLVEIGHGEYDVGASIHNTSSAFSYETPELTPTTGRRILLASIGSIRSGGSERTIANWTNDFVEVADVCIDHNDAPMQGVTILEVDSDGATSYSTAGTYSAGSHGNSAIIASFVTELEEAGDGFVPNLINNPSLGGYPDATNTGVPEGVTLDVQDLEENNHTISTDGAVIENIHFLNGRISVDANNVTIRNCRIETGDFYPIINYGTGLLIEDCDIIGTSASVTAGVSFTDYTVRRCNISGAADGLKADRDCVIEDNYIHSLVVTQDSHNDGIQTTGGNNVSVIHNTIDSDVAGVAIQFGSSNSNWVVDGNLIRASGWALNGGAGTMNSSFTNNRFAVPSDGSWYGPNGVSGEGTNITWSGNRYDSTGGPA